MRLTDSLHISPSGDSVASHPFQSSRAETEVERLDSNKTCRLRAQLLDCRLERETPAKEATEVLQDILSDARGRADRFTKRWAAPPHGPIGNVTPTLAVEASPTRIVPDGDTAAVTLDLRALLGLDDLTLSTLCIPAIAFAAPIQPATFPTLTEDLILESLAAETHPAPYLDYDAVLDGSPDWHHRLTQRMPADPGWWTRWPALSEATLAYLAAHELAHAVLGHRPAREAWMSGTEPWPADERTVACCLEMEADSFAVDALVLLLLDATAETAVEAIVSNPDAAQAVHTALSAAALVLVWLDARERARRPSVHHPAAATRLAATLNRALLYAFAPHVAEVTPTYTVLRADPDAPTAEALPLLVQAMRDALTMASWAARFLGTEATAGLAGQGRGEDVLPMEEALLTDLLRRVTEPDTPHLRTAAVAEMRALEEAFTPVYEALDPYRRIETLS